MLRPPCRFECAIRRQWRTSVVPSFTTCRGWRILAEDDLGLNGVWQRHRCRVLLVSDLFLPASLRWIAAGARLPNRFRRSTSPRLAESRNRPRSACHSPPLPEVTSYEGSIHSIQSVPVIPGPFWERELQRKLQPGSQSFLATFQPPDCVLLRQPRGLHWIALDCTGLHWTLD